MCHLGMHGGRFVTLEDIHFSEKWNKNFQRTGGWSSPDPSISKDRCQNICHLGRRIVVRI